MTEVAFKPKGLFIYQNSFGRIFLFRESIYFAKKPIHKTIGTSPFSLQDPLWTPKVKRFFFIVSPEIFFNENSGSIKEEIRQLIFFNLNYLSASNREIRFFKYEFEEIFENLRFE